MTDAQFCAAQPSRFWSAFFMFLLIGYYTLSRSFSYLGIPPWRLFIGEIALGLFLLVGPKAGATRWLRVAVKSDLLRPLFLFLLVMIGFGCMQSVRGMFNGYSLIVSFRDLAFDYYPAFLFFGVWYGATNPGRLQLIVRRLAWFNGLYGVAYLLFLNKVMWTMRGIPEEVAQVPIFGQPQGAAVAILGLLCFGESLGTIWLPLILNAVVLLGMIVRGEWLGFFVALVVYAWVQKRLKRALAGVALVLGTVAVMFLFDVSIPVPSSRIEEQSQVSARDLVGRVLAPVNPDAAAKYAANADIFEGTATWRVLWWANIWQSSTDSVPVMLLGHGYGYPLGELSPFLGEEFIRTPHSFLMYALGYTGWIGLLLFLALQLFLGSRLLRVQRSSGQAFGLMVWSFSLINASFAGFFEVPHGAISCYLLLGCCLGSYGAAPEPAKNPGKNIHLTT